MAVPNPFQHLCLPPVIQWSILTLWTILFSFLVVFIAAKLLARESAIKNKYHPEEGSEAYTQSVKDLRTEIVDSIHDSHSQMVDALIHLIIEYVDMNETAREVWDAMEKRESKNVKFQLHSLKIFVTVRKGIQLMFWVLSMIAVLIQFHLYRTSDDTKGYSGWRYYQSLIIVTVYYVNFPLTIRMLCDLFEGEWIDLSERQVYANIYHTRYFMIVIGLFPVLFTHVIPAVVMFLVPVIIVLVMIRFYVRCYFKMNDIRDKDLIICFLDEEQRELFGLVAYILIVLGLDLAVVSVVAIFIRWTGGEPFSKAFSKGVTHGHCNEFISFDSSKFSWREWIILFGWIIG